MAMGFKFKGGYYGNNPFPLIPSVKNTRKGLTYFRKKHKDELTN